LRYDLVVKGGLVVTAERAAVLDVAVSGERIAAVGHGLHGAEELDATGLYVIPGAIDGHVHFDDPTFPPFATATADDFVTGTRAAAFGGTTTIVDFAQPTVGQSLVDGLEQRMADADGAAVIDYGLHVNVRDPDPARLDEMPELFRRGVPSIKLYMAYDGYRLPDDAIFRTMRAVGANRGLSVLHAENDDVIRDLTARLAAEGKTGPEWLASACPPEAEAEAVHRGIALAGLAGTRLLVFHLSCAEAAAEVVAAKENGREVAGEVTSHGLVLEQSALQSGDLFAQSLAVRPPLRDGAQREALWRALVAGTIDIVSSDHCPRLPRGDTNPAGISGVEARLALVHAFGVGTGRIDLPRWVDACCTRPAEIFGLERKGRLRPGCDADIVLFDPEHEVTLSVEALHSALPFCSYEGTVVRGFPVTIICRGEVIVAGGEFVGAPGRGRFVERGY
jgi:dihydropyrimidinase